MKVNMEHSSLPKAKSKPRHQKHYHCALHSTLFQISHFGQFSTEVPRTLSCLALHGQMQLPKASRFWYHTQGPACTASPAAVSPMSYNGRIHRTHPSLQGIGCCGLIHQLVQWMCSDRTVLPTHLIQNYGAVCLCYS